MQGMYSIEIFETAISICGYKLSRIHSGDQPYVRKAEGFVPIVKKRSIDGVRQNIIYCKKVRWSDIGRCYSIWSNKRYRQYDLPLSTVYNDKQRKEVADVYR